jgi:thiol-disulfide isomerase/thioredoxin
MPSPIIVGKVYANWCGHCQILKPEWKKLKRSIPVGRVEFIEIEESESAKRANFEKKIKTTLNVNGYPTIFKIHKNKQVEYYTGPRTADEMRKWVLTSKKPVKNTTIKRINKKTRTTQRNWVTLFQ